MSSKAIPPETKNKTDLPQVVKVGKEKMKTIDKSVRIFAIDEVEMAKKMSRLAREKGARVRVWSKSFDGFGRLKTNWFSVEAIFWPDGRTTSPYGCRLGLVWSEYDGKPITHFERVRRQRGSGPTFASIYTGAELRTQAEREEIYSRD